MMTKRKKAKIKRIAERVRKTVAFIKQFAKDGDTINYMTLPPFRKGYGFAIIGALTIMVVQRSLLLSLRRIKFIAYWYLRKVLKHGDIHTMQYFIDGTRSVHPPKASILQVKDYAESGFISIYRYTGRQMTKPDVAFMKKVWDTEIMGTDYDYRQLMRMFVAQMLGYPYDEKVKWIDGCSKMKVCSVARAVVQQKWRKWLEKQGVNIPRDFSTLNSNAWNKLFMKKFKKNGGRWHVESTYPALYANTGAYFNGEYRLVAVIRKGKLLYKSE